MTTDQRLARLERQCRLFRAGFALTAIMLVTVLLVGAGQDQEKPKVLDEVRAKKFLLVDVAGNRRGGLLCVEGLTCLNLCDEKGSILLGTMNGWSTIELGRVGEQASVAERLPSKEWGEWMARRLKTGKARPGMGVSIMLGPGGRSSIRLADGQGNCRVKVEGGDLFGPHVVVLDQNGRKRALLGCSANGIPRIHGPDIVVSEPTLALYDQDGKVVFRAPK